MCVCTIDAYLGDTTGLVSDHRNKASIAVKHVLLFLLIEDLAFSLQKM